MKYQLTEEADRDVEEILAYSVKNFGVTQTQHYFEALKVPQVSESKYTGLPEINDLAGFDSDTSAEVVILCFPHESHVVFYKKLSSSILVVRVLHERMDPKLRLKK